MSKLLMRDGSVGDLSTKYGNLFVIGKKLNNPYRWHVCLQESDHAGDLTCFSIADGERHSISPAQPATQVTVALLADLVSSLEYQLETCNDAIEALKRGDTETTLRRLTGWKLFLKGIVGE